MYLSAFVYNLIELSTLYVGLTTPLFESSKPSLLAPLKAQVGLIYDMRNASRATQISTAEPRRHTRNKSRKRSLQVRAQLRKGMARNYHFRFFVEVEEEFKTISFA